MLRLSIHCMEPVLGKCNLSCREGSQERCFRGSQRVQSVTTTLSCDSVCRSWPANSSVVIGLSVHLYSRATSCFTARGVAASSQWTGRWSARFCSHPACSSALAVPLHKIQCHCGCRSREDWFSKLVWWKTGLPQMKRESSVTQESWTDSCSDCTVPMSLAREGLGIHCWLWEESMGVGPPLWWQCTITED